MRPVVRVVGLGPGTSAHLTVRALALLNESPVVRLRTRRHPAAAAFTDVVSYDEFYDEADSFDELYTAIVEDLVAVATHAAGHEVVYAVPGSPTVAERTVELLWSREDVTTILEPAVSVIDLACATLGRDPMSDSLTIVDALGSTQDFRGPGPLLVLQAYSPEVLASVADRLPSDVSVTVLHHLGLEDEEVVTLRAGDLTTFRAADHLTSLWVEGFRDASVALGDLVEFVARLRAECPWDREQTHASLTRHLLEEAYEAIDALETFAVALAEGDADDTIIDHVEEELGDVLFQVFFHAALGEEEGNFTIATIADTLRDKLIGRHPHVFGDVSVSGAQEVASRWEALKKIEKGRTSVTDGIAWQLPALTLYTKLLRKAALFEVSVDDPSSSRDHAIAALAALELDEDAVRDATSLHDVDGAWGDALTSLVAAAQAAGVDLEGVLRERATRLRDAILEVESASES